MEQKSWKYVYIILNTHLKIKSTIQEYYLIMKKVRTIIKVIFSDIIINQVIGISFLPKPKSFFINIM